MLAFKIFYILALQTFHCVFFLNISCRLHTSARPYVTLSFAAEPQISKNYHNQAIKLP